MKNTLQQVIRVLKYSGNTLDDISDVELAKISDTNTKYLQRNRQSINEYFNTTVEPTADDIQYFERRSLQTFINISINQDGRFVYRNVLGAIAGYVLKREHKLLGHIHKITKIVKTGEKIVELMCLINSRKDTKKGTPIHSNNKSARYLLNDNKIAYIDKLFKRSNGYFAGNTSKKWRLTGLSEQILQQIIEIFFDNFNDICPANTETYSSICFQVKWTPLSLDVLRKQSVTTIMHILSMSIGYNQSTKCLIVSLEHTSSTDATLGRCYNVFSRIRSQERLDYGYIGYDISAGLQTICLQLIGASENDYPMLYSYSTDKAFKTSLRAAISDDLGIDVKDAKKKLTAFANGGISGKDKHPKYEQFQKESDRLRREVMAYVAEHNSWLLEQAKAQSRRTLPEDIDWFDLSPEDAQYMARNKASVFFFMWTYYERLIRKAMLQCLPDGIEVHDAVYSKMNVDTKEIEEVISECTGFKVIIDK